MIDCRVNDAGDRVVLLRATANRDTSIYGRKIREGEEVVFERGFLPVRRTVGLSGPRSTCNGSWVARKARGVGEATRRASFVQHCRLRSVAGDAVALGKESSAVELKGQGGSRMA